MRVCGMKAKFVAVTALVVLLAAACSTASLDVEAGPEDATGTTAVTPSTEADAATTDPTTPASGPEADAPSEPGATATDAACPLDTLADAMDDAFGDDPTTADTDAVAEVFDQLAATAPPDVAADLAVLRDAMVTLVTQLQAMYGLDPSTMSTEALSQAEQALSAIDTPELRAASERVEEYYRSICPDYPFDASEDFAPIGGGFD